MTAPAASPAPGSEAREQELGARMSFLEHLVELRRRLIYSLVAIGVGAVAGLTLAPHMLDVIARPMQLALRAYHLEDRLVYTSPTGVVALIIHLGLYLGLVIASPFVFYQLWLFVAPGLYRHERRAVLGFVASTVTLFLAGIAFGYFFMLPYVLRFLISFQGPFRPLISINEYFDLTLLVLLGLGIIFETPVVIFFLAALGVVTPQFLWRNARYAILVITVLAAVFTPSPDATTMLLFMAPMIGLYFVGVGIAFVVFRRRQRAAVVRAGVR